MRDGLTIGQAAAFADVTVKTIRHYHQHGLVDEPRRDSSGYRRYGSADLLRLVQVRTLAAAGVPLAGISGLLDADPDTFAAALADVERQLDHRIDELIARRETLRRLAAGDRVLLPERAYAVLDRAAGLGFTEDDLHMAREGFVLVRALLPEGFEEYLSQIEHSFDDPRYVSLILRCWHASEWEPHDPRVEELATELVEHLVTDPTRLPTLPGLQERADGARRYGMLSHFGEDRKPTWARLTVLIEEKLRLAGVDIAV
ncbi:MAG TPA: MerR family transcriptional regulator [Pseudonocardiaceae bacterium]|nr:MerR family transcriptional regulator [Pseudonocardiaceae bacterium]